MWIVGPITALLFYAFAFRSLERNKNSRARRLGRGAIVLATVIVCVLIQLQRAHFVGDRAPRIALDLLLMAALPAFFPIEAMWLARLFTLHTRMPLWAYLLAFVITCSIAWIVTMYFGFMLMLFSGLE